MKKKIPPQIQKEFNQGLDLYRFIVENSHIGIFVVNNNYEVVYANNEIAEIVGCPLNEIVGSDFRKFLTPSSREIISDRYVRRQRGENLPQRYEVEFFRIDGAPRIAEISAVVNSTRPDTILTIVQVFDITERKRIAARLGQSEERYRNIMQNLEEKVKERTKSLQESNITLEVLLEKRERDRQDLDQQIKLTIQEIISPYIKRLKNSPLNERQKIYLDIIERNLKEITAPFMPGLAAAFHKLTPTEIQVINLIKQNKKTQEIARHLGVSPRTVEYHRDNIRRKMGLQNQKINLRSYLLSIG